MLQMILSKEMQINSVPGKQLIFSLWILTSFASISKFSSAFLSAYYICVLLKFSLEPTVNILLFSSLVG